MIVIEEYACDSKNQLHTRERYHMELLHATLNKIIPTQTQKKHLKKAEHIKAQQKEYKKENAEKIKEYQKEYHKEHYKDNTEKIKAYAKAYISEKIPCPHCNKMFNRGSMTRHIRRKHAE